MSKFVDRIKALIEEKHQEKSTLLNHLQVFTKSLYDTFEKHIDELREAGLEAEFPIPQRRNQSGVEIFTCKLNEVELVYVPQTYVAVETERLPWDSLDQQPTAKLIVFI